MVISSPIFEAYLKCPSKCWFLFLDEKGDGNIYSDFFRKRNNAFRAAGIERLMAKIQPSECVVKPSVSVNIKTSHIKDTAGFLGFNWTDTDCTGLLSIAWRHFWEDQHDKSIKEKLFRYNAQDCEALELLTETIQQIGDHIKTDPINQSGVLNVVQADSDRFFRKSKWQTFQSPVTSLEYINTACALGLPEGPCLCTIWSS